MENQTQGSGMKEHVPSFTSPRKTGKQFSDHIKDYKIGELLGRGGFGVVYAAISQSKGSYGREVAIKMINKSEMIKANLSRRVANEVEIQWQLHHPSILELYNYFEDGEYVYLITEICKNGELFKYLKRQNRPLTENESRDILGSIVRGLQYLHSNGIIHRDLKLSNLLLTEDFDVKIADFGLAAKLSDTFGEQKTMCGTPNYISPEIISRLPYGLAADVWSLGCMMYSLLTGNPPFQSPAVKNTLDKVARAEYTLPDSLSQNAKDLINKLLQKDPRQRLPLAKVLEHPFFDPSLPRKRLAPNLAAAQIQILPRKEPVKKSQEHVIAKSSFVREFLFSTTRLKPIRQETKYGTVEISSSGTVLVCFNHDDFMMAISSNGQKILLFEKNQKQLAAELNELEAKAIYLREQMPKPLTKKFLYAAKFIHLVRAKTPKIIFYSPQAKCLLMENAPNPDFEVLFYSGIRGLVSTSKDEMLIKIPSRISHGFNITENCTSDENGLTYAIAKFSNVANEQHVQPSYLNLFKHIQDCLRQCLEIEHTFDADPDCKYPVICKSSSTNQSITIEPPTNSPSISVRPSALSTCGESLFSKTAHSRVAETREMPPHRSESSNFNLSRTDRSKSSLKTVLKSSSSALVGHSEDEEPTSHQARFITKVGWCIYTLSEKRFCLLFVDGVQLNVWTGSQTVEYIDNQAKHDPGVLPIDRNLPAHIKERLRFLPKFMNQFRN